MSVLSFIAALLMPTTGQAQNSIRNAPQLSALLVHHYECRVVLHLGTDGFKEVNFEVSPDQGGHAATKAILSLNEDQVVANANNQGLMIDWTRKDKAVASVMTMIRKHSATHQVLIVTDPNDQGNRVDFDCSMITFAEMKGDRK